MKLRPRYLLAAAGVFLVEAGIALGYPPIKFVRASLGDVLVIVLIYCAIRGVTPWSRRTAALVGLFTGFVVESLQYLRLAERFNLRPGSVGYIVLGNTFSFSDLVMYALGAGLAVWLDARVVWNRWDAPGRPTSKFPS